MQNQLAVTSSPHLRDHSSTRGIMGDVCLALMPAGIAAAYFFGLPAVLLMLISVATAVVSEWGFQKLSHKPSTIGDLSAVVTGLLVAYNLPANAPWWIAVIGSFIAIVLVKQMFGGIGNNFVNPAVAARIILFLSWGTIMATYPHAGSMFAADATSGATPLAMLNDGNLPSGTGLWDLFIGNVGGVLGETSKLAILLGCAYMMYRKVISWHIPVSFILTAFVAFLIRNGAEIALYEVLSGGLLLGAVFMATDYSTSPVTAPGKIIMGVGCGLVLFVIRAYGQYPEGCSFAILFMNVCTPLIDRLCAYRPFGEVKKHA